MKIESFVILFLLNFVKPQRPFYGVNKPEGYNFGTLQELPQTYQYVSNNDVVDTDSIIRPILSPVERMFEMADQSRKMIDYAEKYEEKKKASMFDPDSFLEALGLKPTTTTKAPTLMEKLFNPFIQPFKKEFERMAKDSPFKSILPSSTLPPTLLNQDGPRRHEANPEVKAYTNIQKLASAFQIDPNFEPLKPLKPPPSIFPFVENSNSPITKSRPIKILEKFFGKEEEKDIFGFPKQDAIDLRNPFTANPLISMFTTQKPKVSVDDVIDLLPKPLKPSFPSLKPDELLKFHQLLPTPKLPNPFENPLLPKSGNKLAEQLKPFLPKV
uniref:DUF148 domain-containing protein n=1 Tax=Parastrongyloides trichosuri TaxID=131310 RepID=A0A0N4ZF55_PARTI